MMKRNAPSASLRSRASKTQRAWGSTKAARHFFILPSSFYIFSPGPWLKSEAPALQAVPSGSVTRRTPPFFWARMANRGLRMATSAAAILDPPSSIIFLKNCGENEIQASLISSASAGATPAPATISGK